MAKKFGKFLLFTATVSAAVGAYFYMQNKKKNAEDVEDEFEDFDEFSGNNSSKPAEDSSSRGYTPLEFESVLDSTVNAAKDSVEKVEEFFDDEDTSMDAM